MSDYGTLQEVVVVPRGSSVTTAASVSDTELVIDSAGDFDEDGGILELNGAQLDYTGITWGVTEDDDDTIILTLPLVAAADVDDAVQPVIGGLAAEDWYAVVDMGPGDSVHIPLTFAQRVLWPEGVYPDVRVIVSDDLQHIEDAPGRPAAAGGRIAAENQDEWTAAGDNADSPGTLTYLPIPHSLMVFKNGFRLKNDQFTLVDQVVTPLASAVRIKSTDDFSAYYDRDPGAELVGVGVSTEIPTIQLVGTHTVVGTLTSLALPVGTQAGDLIVVASVGFDSNGTTDARLTDGSINGAGVLVMWGTEDGSGSALAIHPVSAFGYAVSTVAVYRGVAVADWDSTQIAASPMALPTFPAAHATIGILTAANGSSAGLLGNDTTAQWTNDSEGDGTKAHVSINSWESLPTTASPPGNFNVSGDLTGAVQTTLLLEAI